MSERQRVPSPAKSQGAATPRRLSRRDSRKRLSATSPARCLRLSTVVQQAKDAEVSAYDSRLSVLTDKTDIVEPRRKSWWNNLEDNSRDTMGIFQNDENQNANSIMEEYIEAEVQSQEDRYESLNLPESSGSESICSIIITERKLFTKTKVQQKKFQNVIDKREMQKTLNDDEKTMAINVSPKKLFQKPQKRTRPNFPEALLNLSGVANKTNIDKTIEIRAPSKHLLNNKGVVKRKNMFSNFIVTEIEDEISDVEVQPKVFGFQKNAKSRNMTQVIPSENMEVYSPSSSIASDIDTRWNLLPSSTMVEGLDNETPQKRPRLSGDAVEDAENNLSQIDEENRAVIDGKHQVDNDVDYKEIENMNVNENEEIIESDNEDILNNVDESKAMDEGKQKIVNESVNQEEDNGENENIDKHESIAINQNNEDAKEDKERVLSKGEHLNNEVGYQSKIIEGKEDIEDNGKPENKEEPKNSKDNIEDNEKPENKEKPNNSKDNIEPKNNEYREEIEYGIVSIASKEQVLSKRLSGDAAEDPEKTLSQIGKENLVINDKNQVDNGVDYKESEDMIVSENEGVIESDNEDVLSDVEESEVMDKTEEENVNESVNLEEDNEVDDNIDERESINQNNDDANDSEKQVVSNDEQPEVEYQSQIIEDNENIADNEESENNEDYEAPANYDDNKESDNNEDNQDVEGNLSNASNEQVLSESEQENEIENQSNVNEDNEIIEGNEEWENNEDIENNRSNPSKEMVLSESEQENDVENQSKCDEDNEIIKGNEEWENNEDLENNRSNASNELVLSESEQVNEVENQSKVDDNNENIKDNEEWQNSEHVDNNESGDSKEGQNESEQIETDEDNEIGRNDEVDNNQSNISNEHAVDKDEGSRGEMENGGVTQEHYTDEENDEESEELYLNIEEESDNNDEIDDDDGNDNESAHIRDEDQQSEHDESILENDQQKEDMQEKCGENQHDIETNEITNKTQLKSPESVLQNRTTKNMTLNISHENVNSVRKTQSLGKPLSELRPSMDPIGLRESMEQSDEGSWDSHRVAKNTIRRTLGHDVTHRKSLRTLVMERSAHRHTDITNVTNTTHMRIPDANSTEICPADRTQGIPSPGTRQTTLISFLERIKQNNLEKKQRIKDKVRATMKPPERNIINNIEMYRHKPKLSAHLGVDMKPTYKKKSNKPGMIRPMSLPPEFFTDIKYKPPKRFTPPNSSWATKRLYAFMEDKLEPRYKYKSRVRAERLVGAIHSLCRSSRSLPAAPPALSRSLQEHMAALGIVITYHDFYQFFHDFMPRDIRNKVIPDLINGLPLPAEGIHAAIPHDHTHLTQH